MQPPTTSGQPALSILVLLPASAHMTHNPSPLAPARKPSPLITRKSGSTVPSFKTLASPSKLRDNDGAQSRSSGEDVAGLDPVRLAGRRSSLAPGMGTGTEIRSPELRTASKLGMISPSPPGTPDRSGSPSPGDVRPNDHPNSVAFDSYKLPAKPNVSDAVSSEHSAQAPRATVGVSSEAPAFGSRRPLEGGTGGSGRSRRPVTAAAPGRGVNATLQRGSMALPSGSGLGIGGGSGNSKNRPGWEADEIVSVLRSGGLEGESTSTRVRPSRAHVFPHLTRSLMLCCEIAIRVSRDLRDNVGRH